MAVISKSLARDIVKFFGDKDSFLVSFNVFMKGKLNDDKQIKWFESHKEEELIEASNYYLSASMKDTIGKIKAMCKTSSQRRAFNSLIRTFSTPTSIKECIESSTLDIDNVDDLYKDSGDKRLKNHYNIEINGKFIELCPGPDMYLINAYVLTKDLSGYSNDKVNSKILNAKTFDKDLKTLLSMIR